MNDDRGRSTDRFNVNTYLNLNKQALFFLSSVRKLKYPTGLVAAILCTFIHVQAQCDRCERHRQVIKRFYNRTRTSHVRTVNTSQDPLWPGIRHRVCSFLIYEFEYTQSWCENRIQNRLNLSILEYTYSTY